MDSQNILVNHYELELEHSFSQYTNRSKAFYIGLSNDKYIDRLTVNLQIYQKP